MGTLSIWHWLIVLGIVILVFGTKKLRNLGGDVGGAIKSFKSAMKEGEEQAQADTTPAPPKPKEPVTEQHRQAAADAQTKETTKS